MSLAAVGHIRPDEYPTCERPADLKHEYVSGVVDPWGDPDHPVDPDVVFDLPSESPKSMAGDPGIPSAVY